MTKIELIQALAAFDDDVTIIYINSEGGWGSISYVKEDGKSCAALVCEDDSVFSDGARYAS